MQQMWFVKSYNKPERNGQQECGATINSSVGKNIDEIEIANNLTLKRSIAVSVLVDFRQCPCIALKGLRSRWRTICNILVSRWPNERRGRRPGFVLFIRDEEHTPQVFLADRFC